MANNNGGVWRKKIISEKSCDIRMRQVELGTLLLGNDKNDVIANKLLSYFLCLTFQD